LLPPEHSRGAGQTTVADQLNATGTAIVATATQVANNFNATATALVPTQALASPTVAPTATQPASTTPQRPVNPAQCTHVTNAPPEVVAVLDALLVEFTNTVNVDPTDLQPSPGAVIRVETVDWIYYEAIGLANVETGELHDADQRQPPGSVSRLTVSGVEVGEQVVGEKRAEHIAHLHVKIAFAEGAAGDFGSQVRNGWNGLSL